MGESPEARDDVAMLDRVGIIGRARHGRLEEAHRKLLILKTLGMHEGKVEEGAPRDGADKIEAAAQSLGRDKPRIRIAGEGARVAAKEIARKLVENEEEGERAVGARAPMFKKARRRRGVMGAEASRDIRVEGRSAAEPFPRSRLDEPEADDSAGRMRRAFDLFGR